MKPVMRIDPDGPQGNIFYILGFATGELLSSGVPASVRDEMRGRVMNAGSYEEAIRIIQEYVTVKRKGGAPM